MRDSFSDSSRKICAAASKWNEEVLETDAKRHIPVDILCQRDNYMWWDAIYIMKQ